MKVLFLTRYPYRGASSRYRVYQYLPHLKELGVECEVSSLLSDRAYDLTFSEGHLVKKLVFAAAGLLKRTWLLRNFAQYDIIYMQRELLPFGPPALERWMAHRGAKLIFDYDDALFIHKDSRFSKLASRLRNSDKTFEIFASVDCVVAGNDYLREAAAAHCQDARTLLVAEDTDRIRQRSPQANEAQFVIGWLGSRSTEKYLELIRAPLTRAMSQIPGAVLRIVGGGDFRADFPVEHLEWSLECELDALRSFDLGLMPLPNEEWSKGKSGGKARTYMAAGVVPICSAIGYNLELIQHDQTGLLVSSAEEWETTILELANDVCRRQRISDAARQYVERNFSVKMQAAQLFKILSEVAAK